MKIVVLAGGTSTERDVSLKSGSMIAQALRRSGHTVILLDVYLGYDGPYAEEIFAHAEEISAEAGEIADRAPDIAAVRSMREDPDVYFGPHVIDICRAADLVFLGLHGENGENGKLQAAFDLFGIRYTGSGYLGSALAMDKDMARSLMIPAGIPMAEGFTLAKSSLSSAATQGEDGQIRTDTASAAMPSFGFPCVVKPCCGGSSIGVSIVRSPEEYHAALDAAFAYEDRVVVEKFIAGREFSAGVIDGEAYPIIEIAAVGGVYDYAHKYQAGGAVETCPADIPDEVAAQMQAYALRAAQVLRLEVYCRMDFIMDAAGGIYCLEANTLPGMTPVSLIPQEAAARGMTYEELCETVIAASLRKYE